ncbi:MAG: recombinase family protein [Clostridiales Family XIII bacterium]|nr:recombinase family protein [Clostridiales Family XIII bacterium]
MSYCIYLRKSRADAEAEAHGEGETLARHERLLIELSKRQHLNITEIYREIVSGETIAARPVMQRLLAEVEQCIWDGVIVMEVERLARGDTIDQGLMAQTFKYSGTKIITPLKTYDPSNEFDEEYFEFGLFMSRREYKTINRRLQAGRIAAVKEGRYIGAYSPYGYKRVKIENGKGFTLEIDADRADVVTLIFSLFVYGETFTDGSVARLTIQEIAHKLNELKIKPISQNYWSKTTIRSIITNPVYAGKVRWGWRKTKKSMVDGKMTAKLVRNYSDDCIIADGLHPAIIDMDTFNAAQETINAVQVPPVNVNRTLNNPLAGLIICGKCGRHMQYYRGYGNRADFISCVNRECDNISVQFEILEKRVLDTLNDWVKEYTLKYEQVADERNTSLEVTHASLKQLEAEVQKLKTQLDSVYDFLEQGIYTTEQFLDRSLAINTRLESLKSDRDALKNELKIKTSAVVDYTQILPHTEKVLETYNLLKTAAEKNTLLKEVIEKIIYTKDVKGHRNGKRSDIFNLELYPKLPRRH